MSDPTRHEITWGAILRLNFRFLMSALIFYWGWLAWQPISKEWWGFWLIGGLCLLYAPILFAGTAWTAFKLFRDQHRWRKYRALGVTPRADRIAADQEIAQKARLP